MFQFEIEHIFKQLSLEFKLPAGTIKEIIASVFSGTVAAIQEGEIDKIETFKNIRIFGLGVFRVNPRTFAKLKGTKKFKKESILKKQNQRIEFLKKLNNEE
jgi:hypothetical protein